MYGFGGRRFGRYQRREFRVHLPLPQDDPVQRQPDISLAKEKLGWQPKVALKDGLVRTVEYFEKTLAGAG